MKNIWMVLVALIFSANTFAENATPTPTAIASPTVSPVSNLSPDEKKNLYSEFKKSKTTLERALKHQEKYQIKELQVAQSTQSRQWREKERKLRRDFFDAHMSGPERRQYVQDYLERKKAFDRSLKDALSAKKKEWADKNESYKKRIVQQEIDFKKSLDANVRPAPELWPRE